VDRFGGDELAAAAEVGQRAGAEMLNVAASFM